MNGQVDDYGRSFLRVDVAHPLGPRLEVDALVDTGFSGFLLLTAEQIKALGLAPKSSVQASFANGSQAELALFDCVVDRFGERRRIEAIAGTGRFALVGVWLMDNQRLTIDYPARTVTLDIVGTGS